MCMTHFLANGQQKRQLQHLMSCIGVWVGKTPPLLIGRMKVVLTPGVMHLSLGGQDSPLASGQEKSRLQHLES